MSLCYAFNSGPYRLRTPNPDSRVQDANGPCRTGAAAASRSGSGAREFHAMKCYRGDVSSRVETLSAVLGLAAMACGTVDPGQDVQFAQITYDQNFFYCKVEPVQFSEHCGTGASTDPPGGCHYSVTPFGSRTTRAIPCKGIVPPTSTIPTEAQNNYQAAESEMSSDPDSASLLIRPPHAAAHPRQIFAPDSAKRSSSASGRLSTLSQ